jgi:hypothetical protein
MIRLKYNNLIIYYICKRLIPMSSIHVLVLTNAKIFTIVWNVMCECTPFTES